MTAVELIELEPAPVVVLPRRVPSRDLAEEIGKAIRRVETVVTAARVPVKGAPFVRYLEWSEDLEIEVGIPLAGSHAVPTLRASLLPGGTAITIWRIGEEAGPAGIFTELETWIDAHAEAAGAPWESYWTAPDAGPPRVQQVWPVRLR